MKIKDRFTDFEDYLIDNWDSSFLCRTILRLLEYPEYLKYLFRKADNPRYASLNRLEDWWVRLKCRIKHHPCGSVYYNPGGCEPDGRCKCCGDEIE